MNNEKRACIAYIAAIQINANTHYRYLYDCVFKEYKNYRYMTRHSSVFYSVFDYQRNSYMDVKLSTIYDGLSDKFLSVNFMGHKFSGHDFETGCYFFGVVENDEIKFFDYQENSVFLYKVF